MLMMSGMVIIEKSVDNATNAPAVFVSLLNIAENIVVFAAPGADAEIITTVETKGSVLRIFSRSRANNGHINRRKKIAILNETSFKIFVEEIFER